MGHIDVYPCIDITYLYFPIFWRHLDDRKQATAVQSITAIAAALWQGEEHLAVVIKNKFPIIMHFAWIYL